MLEICYPQNKEDIESVRFLFKDYATSMGFDLSYQNFDKELKELPGNYSLPDGYLLLAKFNNRAVGCVAIKKIESYTCEMKRLYVIASHRGKKIGKYLTQSIIDKARELKYRTIKLDTLRTMTEAVYLYKSLGFKETSAYTYNPSTDVVYLELIL